MTGRAAFLVGAGTAVRFWRAVFLFYVASLVYALPFAVLTGDMASEFGDRSLVMERMAAARDVAVVVDFLVTHRERLSALGMVAVGIFPLFVLAGWFLDGAVLRTVRHPKPGPLILEGARAFGRLLRMVPLSLIFAVTVLGPFWVTAYVLGTEVVEDWRDARGVFFLRSVVVAAAVAATVWVKGTVDVMRAVAACAEEITVDRAFLRGLRFGLRFPRAVVVVSGLWTGAVVVLVAVVGLVDPALDKSSTTVVLVAWVLHQSAAVLRAGFRVGLLASISELAVGVSLLPGGAARAAAELVAPGSS